MICCIQSTKNNYKTKQCCKSPSATTTVIITAIILVLTINDCTALYLPGAGEVIQTVKNVLLPDGGYDFGFKTSNGIEREEKGEFVNGIWTVRGIVSWVAPDNKIYGYEYTADDNGYQQIDMIPGDGDTRVDPKTRDGLLG
ncbi:flexible cuticle protein 12-like [Lycorma delicatula]|uniref:flexible cuticle protein 12-like n=1 Tax=Lycorma delicatula TaxID=130591 RepID=UPI003F51A4A1